jgi:hypothetical protein
MNQWELAKQGNLGRLKETVTLDNVDNISADNGKTCLVYAAQFGNVECVLWLLNERNARVNNTSSYYGWTALHYAAHNGDTQVCHILLSHGANVNAMCMKFLQPHVYASNARHDDVARLLIDAGATLGHTKWAVPAWIPTLFKSRQACRKTAILIMGLYKYKRTTFGCNNRDAMRLVSCAIWETRMLDEWQFSE